MPKNKAIIKNDFYCTECGRQGIPIARTVRQQREPGHLKKLFCLHCKKETNHAEVRPTGSYTYFDFKLEYDSGRFIDGNRIPVADLMECSNKGCEYNIHKKCWNSNYSYECPYRPHKTKEQVLKELNIKN